MQSFVLPPYYSPTTTSTTTNVYICLQRICTSCTSFDIQLDLSLWCVSWWWCGIMIWQYPHSNNDMLDPLFRELLCDGVWCIVMWYFFPVLPCNTLSYLVLLAHIIWRVLYYYVWHVVCLNIAIMLYSVIAINNWWSVVQTASPKLNND